MSRSVSGSCLKSFLKSSLRCLYVGLKTYKRVGGGGGSQKLREWNHTQTHVHITHTQTRTSTHIHRRMRLMLVQSAGSLPCSGTVDMQRTLGCFSGSGV